MKTTAVTLQVSLMGQFRLGWNDSNTVTNFDTPGRQLLAFLILHPHQRHNRRHLAFTFWPDSTEQQARTNLRKALHHFRHAQPRRLSAFLPTGKH